MHLSNLRPFVPAGKDYALSRAFFLRLGFVEIWGNAEMCQLQMGDASFILQDYCNQSMQENLMIMVSVDNLDEFYNHLQTLDLDKHFPTARYDKPSERPWGIRELHLIDPAGVCWHFA